MNKEKISEYLQKEDFDIQMARAAFFAADMAFAAYADAKIMKGANYSPLFCYLSYKKLKSFYQFISRRKIEKVAKKIYVDYLNNKKTIDKIIKDSRKLEEKMDLVWIKYQKEKNIDAKILWEHLSSIIKIAIKWWQYNALIEDKGCVIDEKIIPKLAKKHNWDLAWTQETVSILAHPNEQSAFNQERISLLKICLYIAKNKKLKSLLEKGDYDRMIKDKRLSHDIKQYIGNNFWIKTDFIQAVTITGQSILEEMRKELGKEKDIEKELISINNNFKDIQKQKAKLMQSLSFDKDDLREIEYAGKLIFWLDERKRQMMKQLYYIFSLVEEISKVLKISYQEFTLYRLPEMEALIKHGKKPEKNVILAREDGVLMFFEKGKPAQLIYGEEGKMLLELATKTKKIKELKGTVASKGGQAVVNGIVRIVHDPKKEDFSEQEILVTSMTRVEFVPLMRRAKAIITNEGGLACHAAIVSRELGIPAVIGTKHATKVLKNGNKVEIDLEKGIVKIIK